MVAESLDNPAAENQTFDVGGPEVLELRDVVDALARAYREEIARLSERFGGYASFWLYCANHLIDDPPEEEFIPHPLWETTMWERWTGEFEFVSERPRFQSGPLSSVQIAS